MNIFMIIIAIVAAFFACGGCYLWGLHDGINDLETRVKIKSLQDENTRLKYKHIGDNASQRLRTIDRSAQRIARALESEQ